MEVVIIVFSIMVSLWLDNWNDKRKEQEEVKTFLMDLKEDLKEDTASMRSRIEKLKPYIEDYRFARNLTSGQLDSIGKVAKSVKLHFDIIPFQVNEGNYQGFKSSGKIGFIDDKELKKQILTYHEQFITGFREFEKEHSATDRNLFLCDTETKVYLHRGPSDFRLILCPELQMSE